MAEKFMDIALSFILIVAAILILVPLGSYVVGQITGLQSLVAGPILTAMLVVVIGIMLVFIVAKWGAPGAKFQVLYITILLGVALFLVIKLPTYLPQLYSTLPGGIVAPFSLSPIWLAVIGAGLIGLIYLYSKRK